MTRQDQENREIGKQGTGSRGTQRNHGKTGGMD